MGKPRPPKVNKENLKKVKSQLNKINKLKSRFEILEEKRIKEKFPATYIAFEAIGAIYNGLKEGYSYEDLLEAYPMDWGSDQIILPSALIVSLVDGWSEYRNPDCKKPLGVVLGLEGGGRGKSSAKKKMKTADDHRRLSRKVEELYIDKDDGSKIISEEVAQETIADENNVSDDKVVKAHKKYNKRSRKALKDKGIT